MADSRSREQAMVTHLLLGLLRDHPEPVSNHAQDSSEVSKAHEDPEPHNRLIEVQVLNVRAPCKREQTPCQSESNLCQRENRLCARAALQGTH